ncbi:hypothetical protein A1O1_07425 [Capronia coronata CBS 617.96]|uniref:Uncharacterized protein n=1 Tax=Capronia coronata CBS 617.96 TaxID=1182541 RepID=W9XU83_9EURO|nr:uncharacterized protein A1O1_07425 [Capronia coronata CBS 617.96]EXJ83798.1 hypothetical protein A1O1_07425 [Capronia coronata CBS 617.96]
MPKLTDSTANSLLNSEGVADQQLAEAEARRKASGTPEPDRRSRSQSPHARSRSLSAHSSSSVSTISTSKSRSATPPRSRDHQRPNRDRASPARLGTAAANSSRKRRHRSVSSSYSRSPRSPPGMPGSHRKSRRHRTISPIDRGRPNSKRRGSHRSRTNSPSMDKSQITKDRRSLDDSDNDFDDRAGTRYRHVQPHGSNHGSRSPRGFRIPQEHHGPSRRERSLSPYSKRLALTQAMNM